MSQSSGEALQGGNGMRGQSSGERSEPTEPMSRQEISAPSVAAGRDECYVTLAQVNLLRVRKQTESAMELCDAAVQKWPHRADAHALLGDLYQEAGRVDDAILRYCRVLELDPANKSNRKKMANMVRLKRQKLGPILPTKKPNTVHWDRVLRVIILTFATLMLLTITLAPVIIEERKQDSVAAMSAATVDRHINENPIMLQPIAPETPGGDSQQQTGPDSPPFFRDPVEDALVELMSSDTSLLQQGVQVLNAQEDPSTNGFSITFLDRPISSDADSRAGILKTSLKVAQLADMRLGSRNTKYLSIRCILVSSPTPPTDTDTTMPIEATRNLVFTGDILRSALPASSIDLDTQSADQLQPYFTNIWWGTGEE